MELIGLNGIKEVYNNLQDEESRKIFKARMMYFLDEDDKHLLDLASFERFENDKYAGGYFSSEISKLKELKQSGYKIVLYGARYLGGG